MWTSPRHAMLRSRSALLTAAALTSVTAHASDLSAAQTTYVGAEMLVGDLDVTFDQVITGDDAESAQNNYAYFSGNTLYLGTEDAYGNGLDTIVEFFWFESSIDRQSDFYVAIIKARSTPNVPDDWYLEVDDLPVIGIEANTDISSGSSAFRWDWSLPFENYGIDSYGTATLTNSYGIGLNAEGSAIAKETVNEDQVTVEGTVQTKGFLNSDYKVETQYQVTLYRWETFVDGSPDSMAWDMVLNTFDRDEENAYQEYFLVMQTDLGAPFVIDDLTITGAYNGWWWGTSSVSSVVLEGITLNRPVSWIPPEEPEEPMDEDPIDEEPIDEDPMDEDPVDDEIPDEVDEDPAERDSGLDLPEPGEKIDYTVGGPRSCGGCGVGTAPASTGIVAWLLMGALVRRRR